MIHSWHEGGGPDLKRLAYRATYRKRPDDIRELGYVDATDEQGKTQRTLKWVRLNSRNSRTPVNMTVHNTTFEMVRLLWIDYNGDEVAYSLLSPVSNASIQTFATHPWIARSVHTGERLLIQNSEVFLPTAISENVRIEYPPLLQWTRQRHSFFPMEFKEIAKCLLLCHHRTLPEPPERAKPASHKALPPRSVHGVVRSAYKKLGSAFRSRHDFDHATPVPHDTLFHLSNLPHFIVLKIIAYAAREYPTQQTLLKGLEAAPDLTPIDLTCLTLDNQGRRA